MTKINRRWTPEETLLLELWAGELTTQLIARRLNRTMQSVRVKAYRMRIKLKPDNDNFSVCTLSKILGCDRKSLSYWIKRGKLKCYKSSNGHSGHYRISRKNFKSFYLSHYQKNIFKDVDPDVIKYLIG